MTITVAIITYERKQILQRCVQSLLEQTQSPDQILIIDSSALPLPVDFFPETLKQNIHYIHVPVRQSIPQARNIALRETRTDILTYIDDDAEAKPTYVKAITSTFESNDIIACVGGPTINATAEKVPLEPLITDTHKRIRILPWGEVRSDARRWVPIKSVSVDGAQGGNMSYRTKFLRECQGFDEEYTQPSFREESDVQIQLIRKGYKIIYNPEVFVYHIPATRGGISDFENNTSNYFYLAGKNARRFADKHFGWIISRLSWIFFSKNPPALIFIPLLTYMRKQKYSAWHRGLWCK